MKIWNFLKIFAEPKKTKYSHKEYKLFHGGNEVEGLMGISYKLHGDIYKRMRKIKTPQYKTAFILRNKKAFNTILFSQHVDVIITTKDGEVIEAMKDVKPGYISKYYENANKIFFMTVGTINHFDFKKDDSLVITLKWLKDVN